MLNGEPAVAAVGTPTTKCVAAPEPTVIALEVPVIEEVTVSVAVTVWLPSVFKVTWNTPVPLESVEFGGSIAAGSLLVICTVPV
jgi:hypothetical protein